jgi:hypothetical protein
MNSTRLKAKSRPIIVNCDLAKSIELRLTQHLQAIVPIEIGCWGATEQKTGLRNPAVFSYLETIHALTYIDDETKRRQILNQLNKGEDRHKLARAVFPK